MNFSRTPRPRNPSLNAAVEVRYAFPRGDVISASRAAVSSTSTSADPASNSGHRIHAHLAGREHDVPDLLAERLRVAGRAGHGEDDERPPDRRGLELARAALRLLAGVDPERAGGVGGYSHSIVPGGFDVMSRTTRLTSRISLIIREAMRSSRS